MTKWKLPTLREIAQIIFNIELTRLGSEAFGYNSNNRFKSKLNIN